MACRCTSLMAHCLSRSLLVVLHGVGRAGYNQDSHFAWPQDLTFTVRPGERVIITGDNGCGRCKQGGLVCGAMVYT